MMGSKSAKMRSSQVKRSFAEGEKTDKKCPVPAHYGLSSYLCTLKSCLSSISLKYLFFKIAEEQINECKHEIISQFLTFNFEIRM